ncbi:MAG: hypothetical protein AAGA65_29380, partial [Actinomycetota bacterium]
MFDDVVALLTDRLGTRFLDANDVDEDAATLRTASILAAPLAVTILAETLEDPERTEHCLEMIRSAVPLGLPASATLADIWQDPLAPQSATNLIFGDDRWGAVTAIATETGVTEESADHVVVLSTLAVFATVAQRFGQADSDTIVAGLETVERTMSTQGWDPWLDAVLCPPSDDRTSPPPAPMVMPTVGADSESAPAGDLAEHHMPGDDADDATEWSAATDDPMIPADEAEPGDGWDQSISPIEPVGSVAAGQSVESLAGVEPVEPVSSVGADQLAEPVEPVSSVGADQLAGPVEPVSSVAAAQSVESVSSVDPPGLDQPMQPDESVSRDEPMIPVGADQAVESVSPDGPLDQDGPIIRSEALGPTEQIGVDQLP